MDAASIPLHTSIGDSLKGIVNLMASGKVPVPVATFLAGGRLIALNEGKEGNPPDVRPIAVGETLRRLTGKMHLCHPKGQDHLILSALTIWSGL